MPSRILAQAGALTGTPIAIGSVGGRRGRRSGRLEVTQAERVHHHRDRTKCHRDTRQHRVQEAVTSKDEMKARRHARGAEDRVECSCCDGNQEHVVKKAQNRFWRMVRIVARLRAIAAATLRGSPRIRVMSDASIATSAPVPIAMPTSAWARAGASLIPSPTIATSLPRLWSSIIFATFWSGKTSTRTSLIPTRPAIERAVASLSPVRRMASSPA